MWPNSLPPWQTRGAQANGKNIGIVVAGLTNAPLEVFSTGISLAMFLHHIFITASLYTPILCLTLLIFLQGRPALAWGSTLATKAAC